MKTFTIAITTFAALCCLLVSTAQASKLAEGRVYRTRLGPPQQAIEKPAIETPSLKERDNVVHESRTREVTLADKLAARKALRRADKKQAAARKRRAKMHDTSQTSSKSLHTRRRKNKTNKFDDRDGDGINDLAANPKL